MRSSALVLCTLLLSSLPALSQSGFSSRTYPNVKGAQLVSADINGDNAPEIVTTSGILYNDGAGNFGAQTPYADNASFSYIAIADMNGDSYLDVVGCTTINSGDVSQQMSVTVDINNGNRTFTARPAVTVPGSCFQLAVGDVYRNAHPAVVAVGFINTYPAQPTPQNKFYVLSNDGSGNLSVAQTSTPNLDSPTGTSSSFTNCSLVSVVGGDFKKNGNFDLVLSTYCNPPNVPPYNYFGSTLFYASQGSSSSPGYPTFTFMQTSDPQLSGGKVVDYNGDSTLDITYLSTGLGYGGSNPYSIAVASNDGTGAFTFARLPGVTTGGTGTSLAFADFNGDGIKDAVATSSASNNAVQYPPYLTIYSGHQDGSYTTASNTPLGTDQNNPGDVITADFNRDGKPDIATFVNGTQNGQPSSLIVFLSGSGNAICSAPSTANTNVICSPADGATLPAGTPVTITTASNVTNFTATRIYLDNQDVFDSYDQFVNTTLNVGAGTHNMVLVSYSSSGPAVTKSVTFTVGSGSSNGCIPNSASVLICSPVDGSTTTASSITVTSGARVTTGFITAMRVYIDNVAVYTSYNPGQTATYQFTQNVNVTTGIHNVVVVAYQNNGSALTGSETITVNPSGPCTPDTTTNNVRICSPAPSTLSPSPTIVSMGAHTTTGFITAVRIYIDNNPVSFQENINQSATVTWNQTVSIPSGSHNMVVVAYQNSGGALTAGEIVTVK